MATEGDERFFTYTGPAADTEYPIEVLYCGECSMPVEYCEYYPNYEKCKIWLEKNLPDEFERLAAGGDEEDKKDDGADGEKKKRQTRGGKGMVKAKKKSSTPQKVAFFRAPRGKKKYVTVVQGLGSNDIDLKDASKYFANKFSCGSSVPVAGEDEIVIQGDVTVDLFDIISEKWPTIDEDNIEDRGEMKR